MHFVACYDISSNQLRLRASRILEDYGKRVQESVFELPNLESKDLEKCLMRLKELDLSDEDAVRIYPICEACRKGIITFGNGEAMVDPEIYIV